MFEFLQRLRIGRESPVFVILAEHVRDKLRQIQRAQEYAEGRQVFLVCIDREPRTFPRIFLDQVPIAHGPSLLHIGWPSTNHGTNLDGGVGLEARLLKRFLVWLFPRIEAIFVSDIIGDHAALAYEFQKTGKLRSIFVPEGLSVLAHRGQSRWVERNWKSAAGLIVRDTFLECHDLLSSWFRTSHERRWARAKRPLWRLWRVSRLCLFRPPDPRHWRLAQVDVVMSDWPESVALPISCGELLVYPPTRHLLSSGRLIPNSMVIIGQPLALSVSTWESCFRILRNSFPEIRDVMVRAHPDSRGQRELLEATRAVFSSDLDGASKLAFKGENMELSPENFEIICGVSSTLLFDHLVWAPSNSLLVCLYDALLHVATPAEKSELMKQQSAIQVLREYAHPSRFVFLENL